MEAEANFRYEPQDVAQGVRRMLGASVVFATVMLGFLAALLVKKAIESGAFVAALVRDPMVLVIVAVATAAFGYGLWWGPRRMGRAYALKFGQRDVRARFDDAGFSLDSPGRFFIRHDWHEIDFVRETRYLLVVHLSVDLPVFVPKRGFAPEALQQALALARQHSRVR